LRKSLVKIFAAVQSPNYYEPWRVNNRVDVSGSGCVLPGRRILTNAHVVSNATFIQVLKEGDTRKYTAVKEFVSHDRDLALLRVDDPDFFKGTRPVTFGGLPALRDKISVFGYPVGGEVLSITEGVVSRIEVIPYSHSMRYLLGVQTDAAINPGNSGGPVFLKGRMVGVAFQGYNAIMAQNTGYFIPTPLIRMFLEEAKGGRVRGTPGLGLFAQSLENPSLRAFCGMKPGQTGLLVTRVIYGSSAWGKVQEGDVLLTIDRLPVANDGTVPFRKGERLNFQYPLCLKRVGDKLGLTVLRGGRRESLTLRLKEEVRLVPFVRYDVSPSYFIHGGVIFSVFDTNYLHLSKDPDAEFMSLYYDGLPSKDRREVVLVNHIIPHAANSGYDSSYSSLVVLKVNGRPISRLSDVVEAAEHPLDGRFVVEVDWQRRAGKVIALDAAQAKAATAALLAQNGIPSDRSDDLKGGKP
jgi:S1-C subfamily serine protease